MRYRAIENAAMALVLAAFACDSNKTTGPNASTSGSAAMTPPKTTTEQVARWAPAGASVVELRARGESGLDLPPGIDVFMVSARNQTPPADGSRAFSIVAIVGGVGHPILEDKVAILSAAAKATTDPEKLARLGLLLARRDDLPLTSASTDEQRKAGVRAPAIAGNVVDFWIFSGAPSRNLQHCTLDLSTASLTVTGAK